MFVTLQVLKCKSCGKMVLALSDPRGFGTRLSSHKCAGSWTVVLSEEYPLEKIDSEAYEAKAWEKSDDVVTLRCRESKGEK